MSGAKLFKTIIIAAATQENHISMKTRHVIKWLKSGHEVRVQIQGTADRQKAMQDIFKAIEREVKSGAEIKQKVLKPESIKFNLKPTPGAANLVIPEPVQDDDLDEITAGKDILSKDFEQELLKSIEDEKSKRRKK